MHRKFAAVAELVDEGADGSTVERCAFPENFDAQAIPIRRKAGERSGGG